MASASSQLAQSEGARSAAIYQGSSFEQPECACDYDRVVANAPSATSVEWVFGYGSILFRQGFPAGRSVAGYLKGWRRAFYQLSTDHRGVPGAPGRTVTLVPDSNAEVWGIAYRLPEDLAARQAALQELEWREKQYDGRVYADVHGHDGTVAVRGALTYVGTSDTAANANWGGPASPGALAAQIAVSCGPSGRNTDYLYQLAAGLRRIGADDSHVFDLEARVRALVGGPVGALGGLCPDEAGVPGGEVHEGGGEGVGDSATEGVREAAAIVVCAD